MGQVESEPAPPVEILGHVPTFIGKMGVMYDQDTGEILEVLQGGQAKRFGIERGWKIDRVEGMPFSAALLNYKTVANKPYRVTFRKIGEAATADVLPVATPRTPRSDNADTISSASRQLPISPVHTPRENKSALTPQLRPTPETSTTVESDTADRVTCHSTKSVRFSTRVSLQSACESNISEGEAPPSAEEDSVGELGQMPPKSQRRGLSNRGYSTISGMSGVSELWDGGDNQLDHLSRNEMVNLKHLGVPCPVAEEDKMYTSCDAGWGVPNTNEEEESDEEEEEKIEKERLSLYRSSMKGWAAANAEEDQNKATEPSTDVMTNAASQQSQDDPGRSVSATFDHFVAETSWYNQSQREAAEKMISNSARSAEKSDPKAEAVNKQLTRDQNSAFNDPFSGKDEGIPHYSDPRAVKRFPGDGEAINDVTVFDPLGPVGTEITLNHQVMPSPRGEERQYCCYVDKTRASRMCDISNVQELC